MTGYGGARMKVYLDQKRLQCSSFKDYMSMYEGMESPVIFEKINDRWEVKNTATACLFQRPRRRRFWQHI